MKRKTVFFVPIALMCCGAWFTHSTNALTDANGVVPNTTATRQTAAQNEPTENQSSVTQRPKQDYSDVCEEIKRNAADKESGLKDIRRFPRMLARFPVQLATLMKFYASHPKYKLDSDESGFRVLAPPYDDFEDVKLRSMAENGDPFAAGLLGMRLAYHWDGKHDETTLMRLNESLRWLKFAISQGEPDLWQAYGQAKQSLSAWGDAQLRRQKKSSLSEADYNAWLAKFAIGRGLVHMQEVQAVMVFANDHLSPYEDIMFKGLTGAPVRVNGGDDPEITRRVAALKEEFADVRLPFRTSAQNAEVNAVREAAQELDEVGKQLKNSCGVAL